MSPSFLQSFTTATLCVFRTSGDKFNKEYAYNVRYNYGQEGKRQDWSEWSCVKIINQVCVVGAVGQRVTRLHSCCLATEAGAT